MNAVAHTRVNNKKPFTVTVETGLPDWIKNGKPLPNTTAAAHHHKALAESKAMLEQYDFNAGLSRLDGDDKILFRALLTDWIDVDDGAKYLMDKIMGKQL